jgi:hypothetical protein
MRLAADFDNLNDLRADLEAVEDGLGRALGKGIEDDAEPLLAETKSLTPLGPGPRVGADEKSSDALPHIRDMISVDARGGTVAIIATHPGAVVHEWGGTIAPNGAAITFKETGMARRAAVTQLPAVERNIALRIDRLMRQYDL